MLLTGIGRIMSEFSGKGAARLGKIPFNGVSTIGCLKWGDKYKASHFNTLYKMVRENVTDPYEFICFTDDPNGLECPFEPVPCDLEGWWGKIGFFQDLGFENFLFLDVDIVILDNIDCLLRRPEDFVIIKDWALPGYNSSVFKLKGGSMTEVWTDFCRESPLSEEYWSDQVWISRYPANIWDNEWIRSYPYECRDKIPAGTKIIVFHGLPKPWDIGWGNCADEG
jgi:hypothetical protein